MRMNEGERIEDGEQTEDIECGHDAVPERGQSVTGDIPAKVKKWKNISKDIVSN